MFPLDNYTDRFEAVSISNNYDGDKYEYIEPSDADLKIFMGFSILQLIEFLFILLFAFFNIWRFILHIKNNKLMIKVFYALICIESLLIIASRIVQTSLPEAIPAEICDKESNNKSLIAIELVIETIDFSVVVVLIIKMHQLSQTLKIINSENQDLKKDIIEIENKFRRC